MGGKISFTIVLVPSNAAGVVNGARIGRQYVQMPVPIYIGGKNILHVIETTHVFFVNNWVPLFSYHRALQSYRDADNRSMAIAVHVGRVNPSATGDVSVSRVNAPRAPLNRV